MLLGCWEQCAEGQGGFPVFARDRELQPVGQQRSGRRAGGWEPRSPWVACSWEPWDLVPCLQVVSDLHFTLKMD